MKTEELDLTPQDYKVELPQEIVTVVLAHVRALPSEHLRKRTLWSCCFLSRSWYSAAVQHLYESPKLSNKNFDKFARTICPPVNSHVRHIGLESFIRHLDMGRLAYESSKSLTARLLRRSRESLETFVAPAVSFSVICLAPLSKCRHLRSLDLSRDFYDIDLTQLLNAVGGLPDLTVLSLPRSAMKKRCKLAPASLSKNPWPAKLSRLQINDWLPQDVDYWDELFQSWPPSLTFLAFEDCLNWNPFYQLLQNGATALHIKSLQIGMRREEDGFPTEILLRAFPNIFSLAIPTPVGIPDFATTISGLKGKGEQLKHLIFRPAPDSVQPKPKLTTHFLLKCVEVHPNLVKIELPEAYLDLENELKHPEEYDYRSERMEQLMAARATDADGEVGVYMIEG